jgi:hypothetical protein
LKEIVMFMIVTNPWPVPSANAQLTGPAKQSSKAPARRDEHSDDAPQRVLAGASS